MSRTITAHMFSTLNGVTEHAEHWQFDAFGPEEMEFMQKMTAATTDLVLGQPGPQARAHLHPDGRAAVEQRYRHR